MPPRRLRTRPMTAESTYARLRATDPGRWRAGALDWRRWAAAAGDWAAELGRRAAQLRAAWSGAASDRGDRPGSPGCGAG